MSHDQVIKQIRKDLAQLGDEVRNGPRHETRNTLLSAAAGAVFALGVWCVAFKVLS